MTTVNVARIPPCSIESEEAVIGSCLIDPDAILRVMGQIDPADFYIVKNQLTYDAMLALYRRRQPIDFVTLSKELEDRKQLSEIGGPAYISQMINAVPTAIHAEGYAHIVKRKAIRRKMLQAASDLAQLAYDEDGDEYEQLSAARSKIADITIPGMRTETAAQVSSRVYDWIGENYANKLKPGEVRGIPTGLIDYDVMTGGIRKKILQVGAGRPGMCKSSLYHQVGFMAAEHGARVAIFSLEMTNDEVMQRQQSRLTHVPFEALESGNIDDADWPKITDAYNNLASLPVFIDDVPNPTVGYIESVILKHGPFDLVVVDHLGLMSEVQLAKPHEMVHVVGKTARHFKSIAKDHDTQVILISQLSRRVEERDDKRPVLSDLRDSGNIEEHADEVYMLYRDEYYDPNTDKKNICEVIRRKGRNKAQRKICNLYWNGPTMSLANALTREVAL